MSAFTARITNSTNFVTIASTRTCASEYARVTPAAYVTYPLDDVVGLLTASDTSGNNRTGTYAAGAILAHSATNACVRDTTGSTTYDGSSTWLLAPGIVANPKVFTLEAWFKTSTPGGMIAGFNPSQTGAGSSQDRHLYLDTNGRLVFGVRAGQRRTVRSTNSYADGSWHQVTATFDSTKGLILYADGRAVDSLIGAYDPDPVSGYWRFGYGDLSGWTGSATPYYFKGQLGYVSVWQTVMSAETVSQHYAAGT